MSFRAVEIRLGLILNVYWVSHKASFVSRTSLDLDHFLGLGLHHHIILGVHLIVNKAALVSDMLLLYLSRLLANSCSLCLTSLMRLWSLTLFLNVCLIRLQRGACRLLHILKPLLILKSLRHD